MIVAAPDAYYYEAYVELRGFHPAIARILSVIL